ncbi:hypothetical protein [Pontiella agarivorans]|uniref:Uncharacterized protein n=1 Tax=Pontiella agarivorans TaxID=3038953 RepID=A0ABU5MWW9_9BACT|nr:hypothetical protein [Pontiella agarivorans]MDZ8118720.1 hypothetical protein [Pontiella agarivorans]
MLIKRSTGTVEFERGFRESNRARETYACLREELLTMSISDLRALSADRLQGEANKKTGATFHVQIRFAAADLLLEHRVDNPDGETA